MSPSRCSYQALAVFLGGLMLLCGLIRLGFKEPVPVVPAVAPDTSERIAGAKPGIGLWVVTSHPGMVAPVVEKKITARIERWVNVCPGIERIETKSMVGVSVVTIYFRDHVDPKTALTTINSLALDALPTLPLNTLPPLVVPCNESNRRRMNSILSDVLNKK
jgi:hypothetical protein